MRVGDVTIITLDGQTSDGESMIRHDMVWGNGLSGAYGGTASDAKGGSGSPGLRMHNRSVWMNESSRGAGNVPIFR